MRWVGDLFDKDSNYYKRHKWIIISAQCLNGSAEKVQWLPIRKPGWFGDWPVAYEELQQSKKIQKVYLFDVVCNSSQWNGCIVFEVEVSEFNVGDSFFFFIYSGFFLYSRESFFLGK